MSHSTHATLQPTGTPFGRFLSDGWVTTKRNLLKIKRVPDILVFTLIQPIMFVLLFTYVYGGVIDIPGSSYQEFLMAGIFAQTKTSKTASSTVFAPCR
jgi:ABC-2 type transport system permease protein